MNGTLVILSGPSGVGKDTVLEAWIKRNPRVRRVVTYTTRAPRAGEQDGVSYWFVTCDRFDELVAAGAFLEHKLVHDNWYATPLLDMERMLEQGLIAVLKIDVQGALDAMRLRPDATTIFMVPPSFDDLVHRIRGRATDDEAAILVRLADAQLELAAADRYQHQVVNTSVETAVDQIDAIVDGCVNHA